MGLSFSSLYGSLASLLRWSKEQDVRILMLGLDSAGKVSQLAAPVSFLETLTHPVTSSSDYNFVQTSGMSTVAWNGP